MQAAENTPVVGCGPTMHLHSCIVLPSACSFLKDHFLSTFLAAINYGADFFMRFVHALNSRGTHCSHSYSTSGMSGLASYCGYQRTAVGL